MGTRRIRLDPTPPQVATTVEPSPPPAPETASRARPDPEFAADPFPVAPLPADFPLADHQRLVVNPFLAVAGLVGWAWLTRQLFRGSSPPLALAPTLFLFWLPFLIHFHCLDCGATGLYPRWWQHACPKVVRRSQLHRRGWLGWPRARTQLILWGYVLGAVALLLIVLVGLGAGTRPPQAADPGAPGPPMRTRPEGKPSP